MLGYAEAETIFLPMDWEAIASIPLSTRRQVDFWAWHYEKTGVFTVRSAYRMLVINREKRTDWIEHNPGRSDCSAECKEWTDIWQVQVPSKVRQFQWRLSRQSIPTGDVRHQRHMAPDSRCVVCGGLDSWKHSLIECHQARCVWALKSGDG